MVDTTDEEHLDNPITNQLENPSDQITSTTNKDTINPNQETENMEVHKHPHHVTHKKKWGEYFLEFLMLFLAVFLGFVAENIREHRVEREREKEYILSMIEDAKTDTTNIQRAIIINTKRVYKLDSLANKCFNYNQSKNDDPSMYRLFLTCLRHPDFVSPTERTMTQLKYSGGMRLLQNKIAADSILQYDDFAKKLTNQQEWYENMLKELFEPGEKIFNFKFNPAVDLAKLVPPTNMSSFDSAKLNITDKSILIELGNRAIMYRNVVIFYIILLHEGEQHAANLIQTLQNKYHIENE
jgi:hypothetical protein